jgi:hypothetical protein
VQALNFVNGVELFMACSAGVGFNMDVALFWAGQNDSKAAAGSVERIDSVLSAAERCKCCADDDRPCVVLCKDCEAKQRLCEACGEQGFTEWSHLCRKCRRCHEKGTDCVRCTALGVTADQEAKNVSAFKAMRQNVAGPGSRLLALVHDPYHQVRGQRNVAGGYFLQRDGEWFCLSFILVVR